MSVLTNNVIKLENAISHCYEILADKFYMNNAGRNNKKTKSGYFLRLRSEDPYLSLLW